MHGEHVDAHRQSRLSASSTSTCAVCPAPRRRRSSRAQSALAMYHDGRKIETHLRRTDGAYWQILDFEFLEGGPFTRGRQRERELRRGDHRRHAHEAVRRRSPALGKTFEVDGQRFRVVGVVRAVPITRVVGFSEIWAPIRTIEDARVRDADDRRLRRRSCWRAAQATSRRCAREFAQRLDALRLRGSEDVQPASRPGSTRRSRSPRARCFGNQFEGQPRARCSAAILIGRGAAVHASCRR